MNNHINILAGLHIALSGLILLIGVFVFVALVGGGLMSRDSGALAITSGIGLFVFVLLLVISLPGIIGGIGLLKRRSWSRIVLFIVGALGLLNLPLGTALGIYTFWVLTRPEVERQLR